jgi:hypothetical protein
MRTKTIVLGGLFGLLAGLMSSVIGQQEGIIQGSVNSPPATTDASIRSQADWYSMTQLRGAVDTGTILLTSRTGSTRAIAKAIYNNSGTVVTVKLMCQNDSIPTKASDTMRFKIPEYCSTPKLPPITCIFRLGPTDSLIVFYQYR